MPDDSSTIFVDTNIWLYAFVKSPSISKKNQIASNLLSEGKLILNVQVINEICVNLKQKVDFSESQIANLISSLYKKYHVIEFNKSISIRASKLREQYSFSFWDSLIVSNVIFGNANILYSEDMQHNLTIERTLKIINPFKN